MYEIKRNLINHSSRWHQWHGNQPHVHLTSTLRILDDTIRLGNQCILSLTSIIIIVQRAIDKLYYLKEFRLSWRKLMSKSNLISFIFLVYEFLCPCLRIIHTLLHDISPRGWKICSTHRTLHWRTPCDAPLSVYYAGQQAPLIKHPSPQFGGTYTYNTTLSLSSRPHLPPNIACIQPPVIYIMPRVRF